MSLAARPQLPSDFEATAWAKLKEAVNAIHAKRPVSYSFEELYRVSTSLHRSQSGQARLCTVTLQPSPVDNLETEHAVMQLVEDMCLHKMAGQLYSNLQQECDAHISVQLAKLAADQTMDPVLALEKVSDVQLCHCTQLLTGGLGSVPTG